jgi:RNA polymerase sigma-70 factor, ECF subfamily
VARSSRKGSSRSDTGEAGPEEASASGNLDDGGASAPVAAPAAGTEKPAHRGRLAIGRGRPLKAAPGARLGGPLPNGNPGRAVTPFAVLRLSDRPAEPEDDQARSASALPPFDDAGVGAAKEGDPSSWEAAYLAYARSLMGYLMVRLDNRDDAAEALSETFTRAIDKIATFRGDAYAFRAWLFSIARNVSNDQHRRRARLIVLPDHPEADDRVQPSGEELAISHEDLTELRKGFARLPKADQEVLWLRVCSGLSAVDVGHVMGKKAGAVRMQQMRALGALRGQVRL